MLTEEKKLRLGLMGFGEAAVRIAQDLAQAGLADIVAYRPSGAKEPADGPLHQRAVTAGAQLIWPLVRG